MLKMPEDMSPEELAQWERMMEDAEDKAEEIIQRRKRRRAWSDEERNDSLLRNMLQTAAPGGTVKKNIVMGMTNKKKL